MRPSLLVIIVASILAQSSSQPADEKIEALRATEAAAFVKTVAEAYTVTAGEPAEAALVLEPKSLLKWSNTVGGSFHGSVFVWTSKGRPAVILSAYKKYLPLPHHLGLEFHSLTDTPASADRAGKDRWSSARGGVEFKAVPGAAVPADTPARRLRQLRSMASEFSATETTREAVSRPLRLLTQPIHRSESTDPKVLDGALFAFVEGTDPEAFLLIEARSGEKGPTWNYALARMNSIELHVAHKASEVWSAPVLPWSKAMDPREPYTLFTFRAGEGINPPEATPGR